MIIVCEEMGSEGNGNLRVVDPVDGLVEPFGRLGSDERADRPGVGVENGERRRPRDLERAGLLGVVLDRGLELLASLLETRLEVVRVDSGNGVRVLEGATRRRFEQSFVVVIVFVTTVVVLTAVVVRPAAVSKLPGERAVDDL